MCLTITICLYQCPKRNEIVQCYCKNNRVLLKMVFVIMASWFLVVAACCIISVTWRRIKRLRMPDAWCTYYIYALSNKCQPRNLGENKIFCDKTNKTLFYSVNHFSTFVDAVKGCDKYQTIKWRLRELLSYTDDRSLTNVYLFCSTLKIIIRKRSHSSHILCKNSTCDIYTCLYCYHL